MAARTIVVTGHPRSGTSAILHALKCGGIEVAYSKSRDCINNIFRNSLDAGSVNEHGFYELEAKFRLHPKFPIMYKNTALKILWQHILKMYPGNYVVIFMWRHPEEIRQSFFDRFNSALRWTNEQLVLELERVRNALSARNDCLIYDVQYRNLISNKHDVLSKLKKVINFNVDKAAMGINENLCRYKIENLNLQFEN